MNEHPDSWYDGSPGRDPECNICVAGSSFFLWEQTSKVRGLTLLDYFSEIMTGPKSRYTWYEHDPGLAKSSVLDQRWERDVQDIWRIWVSKGESNVLLRQGSTMCEGFDPPARMHSLSVVFLFLWSVVRHTRGKPWSTDRLS